MVDGFLVVTYSSIPDWEIRETHLFVGQFNDLPTNRRGNPIVGHFPYSGTHSPGTFVVTYSFPELPLGECVYIAAHAVVENTTTGQNETAWGDGIPIGGNNWAMMFEVCNEYSGPF